MIALFIFTSSCEEEDIDNQENNIIQKIDNNKLTERQKINRLKANLKYRVKAYNLKHGKNHFLKKYGGLDLENHISFRFKEIDENFIVVIPFKKNKSKNKILIAYYKNDKEHYKIVNKKNYSKKKEHSTAETAFIDNLDVIFDMIYQNSNASENNMVNKGGNCYGIWMFNYGICTSVYQNSCTGAEFEIDTCGKGGDGEDEVDYDSDGNPIDPNDPFGDGGEILDGEATSYQDIDLGSDNSDPDVDPIDYTDPTDPENAEGECDGLEFDCGTGGGSDDQETVKLKTEKLNDSQKQKLQDAKNDLENDCIGKALLDAINSVKIEVGNSQGYQGIYMPKTNTIHFKTDEDISSYALGPELFHAYQQQLYGNLDDIQDDSDHIGGSNIEFEEKSFNMLNEILSNNEVVDELQGTGTHLIVGDLQGETFEGTDGLGFWLSDILANHPNGNITLNQTELNDWFSALDSFQKNQPQNCGNMYCVPIDKQLKPNAIISLLNKSFNSDCK